MSASRVQCYWPVADHQPALLTGLPSFCMHTLCTPYLPYTNLVRGLTPQHQSTEYSASFDKTSSFSPNLSISSVAKKPPNARHRPEPATRIHEIQCHKPESVKKMFPISTMVSIPNSSYSFKTDRQAFHVPSILVRTHSRSMPSPSLPHHLTSHRVDLPRKESRPSTTAAPSKYYNTTRERKRGRVIRQSMGRAM